MADNRGELECLAYFQIMLKNNDPGLGSKFSKPVKRIINSDGGLFGSIELDNKRFK